jgi:hypothetical protein
VTASLMLCALCALAAPALRHVQAQAAQAAVPANTQIGPVSALDWTMDPATSDRILAHLNAAIHFLRTATAFQQKTGEPSDSLYRDQELTLVAQITQAAFASAKAEAALLNAEQAQTATSNAPGADTASVAAQQHLQAMQAATTARIAQLQAAIAAAERQMATASGARLQALSAQHDSLRGQLDLEHAMQEVLERFSTMNKPESTNTSKLSTEIARLELTAPVTPQAAANPPSKPGSSTAFTGTSIHSAEQDGVLGQAETLFAQLNTLHQMNLWIAENDHLRDRVTALHDPLVALLRRTLQEGNVLTQGNAPAPPAPAPAANNKGHAAGTAAVQPAPTLAEYEQLTAQFRQISAASLPLAQELLLLDQSHANLLQWRDTIDSEYDRLLRALLLRVAEIALGMGLILLLSEIWRRASIRYVRDIRRRRQLLILRRFATSFCMGVVLILGFVSQFSSLATFAGFITAGIAVGLQTVLLSVAAYFFIVGRYGVRVGDRISVAGVTGDVMDISLVRLYVMELAGTGIDLYPTGRVAVFSNAVLFQATTPLYKQIPGTEYGWREVAAKLNEDTDYKGAAEKITALVTAQYKQYEAEIARQHGSLELHWEISAERPKIESRLQFVEGGLEYKVRYPVLLRRAAEADEAVTRALVELSQKDAAVKAALAEPPLLRTSVKV